MFLFAGVSHFGLDDGMVRMLPARVPGRYPVIYITGMLEIAMEIGLLPPR
jgi:uncharacterized membrane protein